MKLNSIILNSKKNIKKWREILNKFPPEKTDLYYFPEYVNLCLNEKNNAEGLMFIVLHSSRWMGEDDPLRPKEKEYNLGYKGYIRPDVRQET